MKVIEKQGVVAVKNSEEDVWELKCVLVPCFGTSRGVSNKINLILEVFLCV